MPEFPLQDVIDGLRTRLQAELDAVVASHAETLARAREDARQQAHQEAEAAAEQRWRARLDATRQEWSARLSAEVESTRVEAERRLVAETMRVRMEAEQSAAEAAAAARAELEQKLAAERQRAQHMIETERAAAEAQFAAERQRVERAAAERVAQQVRAEVEQSVRAELEREIQERMARELTSRPAAAAGSGAADLARLRESVATLDAARSLSDVLALTAASAALQAPRACLFVVNGPQVEEWHVPDVPALSPGVVRIAASEAGILGEAVRSAAPVQAGTGLAAPAFSGLSQGARAIAVPLALDGEVVAVVYADAGEQATADGWPERIELLGRHAAARLAHLTAVRTAEAVRLMRGAGSGSHASADDGQSARRYARLLVSEIKLYNEAAVRAGRENRDLLRRLKPEIDRARRLYDERIPVSVPGRDACFQQELVQTLADGDAALLG